MAGKDGTISGVTAAMAAPSSLGFQAGSVMHYEEQIKQHKLREAISHGRVHAKIQQQLDHLPLAFLFNYRNDDNYKLYVQNRGLDVIERMCGKLNDGSVRSFFCALEAASASIQKTAAGTEE